jgi:hypothetical protein
MGKLTKDQIDLLTWVRNYQSSHKRWVPVDAAKLEQFENIPAELFEYSNEGDVRLTEAGEIVVRYS